MVTAAAGDHPVDSSELAKVPDVPKVAAEKTASARPEHAGLCRFHRRDL